MSRSTPLVIGIAVAACAVGVSFFWSRPTIQDEVSAPPSRSSIIPTQKIAESEGSESAFQAFQQVLESLARTDSPSLSGAALDDVVELARQRQPQMEALMRQAPERALQLAIGFADYHKLPPAVQALVEEPFSEAAKISILPICQSPSGETPEAHQIAQITFDGRASHEAILFGQRRGMSSKDQSPVQGIRMAGIAVLAETTFTPLTGEDAEVAAELFPLANPDPQRSFSTGVPLTDKAVVAIAGGKRFVFADEAELATFDEAVSELERTPGPKSGAGLLFAMPAPADGSSGFDLDGLIAASEFQASSWTETPKSVFVIRVDFPDKPSIPSEMVNAATLEQVFDTTVDDQIQAMSYGKTAIESTVSPTVTRLPSNTTTYTALTSGSSQNDLLYNDALATYSAATSGWSASNYDIVGVWFVDIEMRGAGIKYAGLAGGSRLWLQGNSESDVITHELGHNYGLGHSSFWVRSGGSNPVDPSGTNDEYGDPFDIMGDGEVPDGHFNVQGKAHLNWITSSEWTDATAAGSGQHRIHRIDAAGTTGLRGLRVTKAAGEYYWIGHRRAYVNESLDSGAYMQWQRPTYTRSWLLDMTPNSASGSADREDGGLLIGRTYTDSAVHITPVAKGGAGAGEWLEVQVNLGTFPGNTAPVASITAPATVPARTTVFLSATATDANGDPLAYSWDLGDGRTADNHATIPYSWTLGGSYTVSVTVTDMKGGTATATHPITVTDAINTWNARTTSSNVTWTGLAQNGTRVVAVGEDSYVSFNGAWAWSIDGTSWTSAKFTDFENLYAVAHDGTQFIAAGQKYDFTAPAGWRGYIATSPDGATWTQRYYAADPLERVVHGGGITLAVTNNQQLVRSTDATTWAAAATVVPPTQDISGLAYGNGVFVLTAHNNTPTYNGNRYIATSTDGITWTDRSSGATMDSWQDLRETFYLKDRFFSSGFYSQVRASTDLGQTFPIVRPATEELTTMAYGAGIFLGIGDNSATNALVAIASQNGTNWSPVPAAAVANINAAIFFNNTFIIAGDSNVIRQSGTIVAGASGFVPWRDQFFPDRGADSLPTGETDNDGLKTLLEYGLGTSPLSGVEGVSLLPSPSAVETDPLLAGRLTLSFSLPQPARADLVYTVEVSNDNLGTWTPIARKTGTGAWQWLPGGTARIVTGSAGGREQVKVADPTVISAGTQRFLHLSVTPRDPAP